jgi:phage/plasmid-associated DNA primase
MLVLACNQRFFRNPGPGQKRAVEGLHEHILNAEKLGIIAWAVRGLERLLAQARYTDPASSTVAIAKWKTSSDQLEEFFTDTLEFAPKGHLPRRAVYEAYRQWALSTGHKVIASERFRETFIAFLKRKTGDEKPNYKSHGIDSYRGIRARPDDHREQLLAPVREGDKAKIPVVDALDFLDPLSDGGTARHNGGQPS